MSTTLFHLRQTIKGAQCSKYLNCPLSGYKLHLHSGPLVADTFIQSDLQSVHLSEKKRNNISLLVGYSKDIHRNKCQAFTIARLTPSCLHQIARIRRHTLSTTFKWQDVQHKISMYIKKRTAKCVN